MKAATLIKAIELITDIKQPDPSFVRGFLLTYRSFTTPKQLLDCLIIRHKLPKDLVRELRLDAQVHRDLIQDLKGDTRIPDQVNTYQEIIQLRYKNRIK